MNDLPRKKLGEIVSKHGMSVVENPRRCEGLLRDYCGGFRREVSVLTMALEERVPLDLLAGTKTTPRPVLFGRLTQKLCDNLALAEPAALWSVHSWAFALKLINEDELKIIEQQSVGQTQQSATVASVVAQTTAHNKTQSGKTQSNQVRSTNVTPPKPSIHKSFVVSSDGTGDFASITEAIRNVAPNSRLLIRPGVYKESIMIDKNVEIVGDSTEQVIVASYNSSCIQIQTDQASVRGLTLRGLGAKAGKAFFAVDIPRGELVLENCDISSDSLSCVAIHGVNANPALVNCLVHDGADSGIYFFDNARGRVENCDIYRNRNDGAAITGGANPLIKNCRIFDGNNGGVVAWRNGAAGTIEDCKIFGHRLANIGISEYANPIFRRCEISGSADAGVFVQRNGYGKLEECEIHSNDDAEVAISTGGNPSLRRCVIHNGNDSGVFLRDKGRGLLENCNIYDNAKSGVNVRSGSAVEIRQCNIHRNGKVAVSVKENSAARVEDSDLRGNRIAAWESEYGVTIERKNNRE